MDSAAWARRVVIGVFVGTGAQERLMREAGVMIEGVSEGWM